MANPAETGRQDDPLKQEAEKEQTPEAILDALESAFEKGAMAELTVLESSGELRTNAVFIEGLESGILAVSGSKSSPVMEIRIVDIKQARITD